MAELEITAFDNYKKMADLENLKRVIASTECEEGMKRIITDHKSNVEANSKCLQTPLEVHSKIGNSFDLSKGNEVSEFILTQIR